MQDRRDAVFRKQIVDECDEVGNIALVARRHGIPRCTVDRWVKEDKTDVGMYYIFSSRS